MNNLFTHKAMTAVLKPNTVMDDSQFDYNQAYLDFFEYMAQNGCIEYDNPEYLRNTINEFGKKFVEEYKSKFLAIASEKDIVTSIEQNKKITIDEYFFDLRLKYVGNLFEAIMQCYFSLANVRDPRLQQFTGYEEVNGGDWDFKGVDAWLTESTYGIKIPVNAKHKTLEEIREFAPFQKLQSASREVVKELKKKSLEAALAALDCPSGILFTDIVAKPLLPEKFPDVILIDSWTLFQALGKGAVPNKSFWEASLELMKK